VGTTREDVDPRHEPRPKRAATSQHLERPALAAQQYKGGSVAWTHDRVAPYWGAPFLRRAGAIIHRLANAGTVLIYTKCAKLSIIICDFMRMRQDMDARPNSPAISLPAGPYKLYQVNDLHG